VGYAGGMCRGVFQTSVGIAEAGGLAGAISKVAVGCLWETRARGLEGVFHRHSTVAGSRGSLRQEDKFCLFSIDEVRAEPDERQPRLMYGHICKRGRKIPPHLLLTGNIKLKD
jgi:hypothetical protein